MTNDEHVVLQQLKDKLRLEGYVLNSFKDRGKHYLGIVNKDNKDFYVKLSKSKEQNQFLQNGAAFDQELIKLNPPFNLPVLIISGTLSDEYYYRVETKLEGTPYALLQDNLCMFQIERPEQHFLQIYKLTEWLSEQKIVLPLGIFGQLNLQNIINTMIDWGYNATPHLSDLLKIVKSSQIVIQKVTAHCDLTPSNIIVDNKGTLGLIDGDIAHTEAPRYYDVAEFYNRLWTRACRPDLAKQFLKIVVENLQDNKDNFYQHLLVILASRAVGNFWEVMSLKENQEKRIKYLASFADNVVDKDFFN